jgi:cell wall-associated NlpC family hydrolase
MDCSLFVRTAYQNAGFKDFPTNETSRQMAADTKNFTVVSNPQPGDLVYWPMKGNTYGHIGIVNDPNAGTFSTAFSSTSTIPGNDSGIHQANYTTNRYWSQQPGRMFLRYKSPSAAPSNPSGQGSVQVVPPVPAPPDPDSDSN